MAAAESTLVLRAVPGLAKCVCGRTNPDPGDTFEGCRVGTGNGGAEGKRHTSRRRKSTTTSYDGLQ